MTSPQTRNPGKHSDGTDALPEAIRLDKWLWHARFFKTRGLASREVSGGHVRVNGQRPTRPARPVRPGDTLTLRLAGAVRVVHIRALGDRRGPATEARALYAFAEPASDGQSAADGSVRPRPGLNAGEDRITSSVPQTGRPDP